EGFYIFGTMGVLHATTIVVSLRDRRVAHPLVALWFIALAAVWSVMTPLLASSYPLPGQPGSETKSAFLFVLASAIGSLGYWLLVRLFWLKSLRPAQSLKTVVLCVAATLLSIIVTDVFDKKLQDPWPTITAAWWFAFSISLYWSESKRSANSSTEPIE